MRGRRRLARRLAVLRAGPQAVVDRGGEARGRTFAEREVERGLCDLQLEHGAVDEVDAAVKEPSGGRCQRVLGDRAVAAAYLGRAELFVQVEDFAVACGGERDSAVKGM